jgi:hypothetical protein
MSSVEQLEQLVGQLMSPDNNVRNHAETMFNEFKKNPDMLIITLTQLLRSSQHEAVRITYYIFFIIFYILTNFEIPSIRKFFV